jgi:hypothetical protein
MAPERCLVQAKRRVGRGMGCGRGPSAFFEGGTDAAGAPREPAVTDTRSAISWTPGPHERWGGKRPRPADPPALRSGATVEQALKDARQVEAAAGCSARTAGKGSADDSAILTVAGACDGTTGRPGHTTTCRVACNCGEPETHATRSKNDQCRTGPREPGEAGLLRDVADVEHCSGLMRACDGGRRNDGGARTTRSGTSAPRNRSALPHPRGGLHAGRAKLIQVQTGRGGRVLRPLFTFRRGRFFLALPGDG